MHFTTLIGVTLLSVLGVHATPQPQAACMFPVFSNGYISSCASSVSGVTTTTLSLTLTITSTHTYTATVTSSAPETTPTVAYSVIAARSASPIHLQGISAAGFRLWVGGSTAAYCPTSTGDNCPPGNVTAFLGTCAMVR